MHTKKNKYIQAQIYKIRNSEDDIQSRIAWQAVNEEEHLKS